MENRNDLTAFRKRLFQITNLTKKLQSHVDKLESEISEVHVKSASNTNLKVGSVNTIGALKRYFGKHGISALKFNCKHHHECLSACTDESKFTTAREPYIGAQYGQKGVPRLLFLSLDAGGADADPKDRTISSMRKGNLRFRPEDIPKVRHWYKTHQFAWTVFNELSKFNIPKWDVGHTNSELFFEPETEIYKIMPYFAHTNSAKCCMNNKGSKLADKILFENCRKFIPDEIKIFDPHILVTQGAYARKAIDHGIKIGSFTKIRSKNISKASSTDPDLTVLDINSGKRTMWIHHYHPSNYGTFAKNYKKYRAYAKEAAKFISKNHPHLLT